MIDPSVAGRTYPAPRPYAVSREKVREFALAIGDALPAYLDATAARALGHVDVIAPPTFAAILAMDTWRDVMADLGVDFSRVLHTDQRFVADRPLRAGDIVQAETIIDDVRERMGASWLTLRTDLVTDADEHVCTAVATIMVRPAESRDGPG